MRVTSPSALVGLGIAFFTAGTAPGLDLKPQTLAAFERYARLTEARIADETAGRAPLLWINRLPAARQTQVLQELRGGKVVVEQLETRDGGREIDADDGMIHHWIGTVLLPGATLDRVIPFVQDYAKYPQHFAPMIQRSSIRSRDGDRFVVPMRTSMTRYGVTVVLDADYTIEYRRLDANRVFTRSITTNIHEISDAGKKTETRKPADQGTGFLWRLHTYCSFEARPEGTYEQCESISLTRGLPFLLGMFRPLITGIPRDTLTFTLGQVQKGLR
jgi:hypothetical protein